MKQLFIQHKTLILRTLGSMMLVIGFAAYFWTTPKPVLTQNEIAAKNVARMEAKVQGGSSRGQKPKSSSAKVMSELKETQKKQLRYMVILMMIFGVGFLGYTFIPSRDSER